MVLSASHNAFADNGVKFFAAGGRKLSDDVEAALEAELAAILDGAATSPAPPSGAAVGTLETDPAATAIYVDHLTHDVLEGRRLNGLRVVIDTANGAACATAPRGAPGARRRGHACCTRQPDGTNINDGCGSTYPADLQQAVPQRRADLGLAFDGDADRVLAVDAEGQLVDGDHIIGICAVDRRDRGLLPDDTVVVTVMTNLGFRLGMQRARREGDRDQRRRPPRAGGARRGRLGARWRAVGPRDLPRPRHHRRRPAHRAAAARRGGPHGSFRSPTWRPPP